jgi:hypothetical protein
LVLIVANAPNASQAEGLANSVAATFVTYLSTQASALENGATLEYSQQAKALTNEINDYSTEITKTKTALGSDVAGSTKAASDEALEVTETQALNGATEQLKIVDTSLAELQSQGGASASGTEILQRATTAIKPSILRIPELGVIGLLVGLLVGVCAAFAVGRRDRRLRKRDDIARAAGAPVLASLTAVRRTKSQDLLQVLENFQPSVSDKANLRRLLDELGVRKYGTHSDLAASQNGYGQNGMAPQNGSSGQNGSSLRREVVDVSAIVLAGDTRAVVAITELPAFAAGLGLPVALVVESSTTSTQQLAIACAARDPLDIDAPRPNLLTFATAPEKAPEGVSLTVTIEVVDPATLDVTDEPIVDSGPDRQHRALLVVSSGFATPEDLEVVAQASEHHGIPLVGVVVVDPEHSDKTSGQQQPRRVMGLHGPRQLSALRSTTR